MRCSKAALTEDALELASIIRHIELNHISHSTLCRLLFSYCNYNSPSGPADSVALDITALVIQLVPTVNRFHLSMVVSSIRLKFVASKHYKSPSFILPQTAQVDKIMTGWKVFHRGDYQEIMHFLLGFIETNIQQYYHRVRRLANTDKLECCILGRLFWFHMCELLQIPTQGDPDFIDNSAITGKHFLDPVEKPFNPTQLDARTLSALVQCLSH